MCIRDSPSDTTRALTEMKLAGVFSRYPDLRVVAVHGAGGWPMLLGRLRRTAELTGCPPEHLEHARHAIYTDSLTHNADALRSLVALMGSDRVLLGSDYPFPIMDRRPVEATRQAELGDAVTDQILHHTARSIGLAPTP